MKKSKASAINPPITASPATTPELKELFPASLPLLVGLIVPSKTLCRTHSPNVQLLNVSPEEPNNDCNKVCLNEQVEPESHETPTVPSSPFMVLVRLVEGTAPQSDVLGIHLQARF
jgi:hypothetical protein